ncbi:MAG: efflux RND transporter periplasmic adaptor subunit [Tepidisphaeraceae bacterium]|jgi:multidrug efflux pump subunit AcrA (membrane-fusion protein)
MKRSKWIHSVLVASSVCLLRSAVADEPAVAPDSTAAATPTVVQGLSTPSSKHNLSFMDVGVLKDVLVKPGDVVTVGQVLAQEDSDLDEMDLKALKIDAESTSKIDAAKVDAESKRRQWQNKQKAYQTGGAANLEEVEEAKLDYDEAVIEIQMAKELHDEKLAELDKQQLKVDKMKLLSPVDGIVEKVSLHSGEVVDPNQPDGALTVVKIKPLWVDMHLTMEQTQKLKLGDKLSVAYVSDPDNWITGTVIYFDPVVDATVDQQTVRLELENEENKPAGLQVNVRLP